MNIALLNNRYFMAGGTTRYMFNVEGLMRSKGHVVVPFSNAYPETVETEYAKYFVSPPGGKQDAAFYRAAPMTPQRAWGLFTRGVYDRRVKRRLGQMLDAEAIELVYSINICNFIGPSVIDAARHRGLPYVMRLSDFNLICPSYLHLRNGQVCEDCKTGLLSAVRHKCLQGSTAVSLARVMAMWAHRLMGVHRRVSRFVTPSAFLRGRLIEAGYPSHRIDHIPTFVRVDRFTAGTSWRGNEIIYTGRLAPEKGPDILIRAAGRLPASSSVKVVLVGDGDPDYVASLKELAQQFAADRIEFTGYLDSAQLTERLGRAQALALPARWFENMPNSITEAMAMARPVLATPLGSLPEQVLDAETGLLVGEDDTDGWAATMDRIVADPALAERLGRAGRARAEQEFSPQLHYRRLMETFQRARVGD